VRFSLFKLWSSAYAFAGIAGFSEVEMAIASGEQFGSLKDRFAGEVLLPADTGYDDARSLWNGEIDRRPAAIARCTTIEQVATAVSFAQEYNLEIAVRGGGHNYAGHGCCDGGLMIDLSGMNTVTVDPAARRARCGGGTTWAELDAATQEHGLATIGGVISHTGVGGLTLGGGIGWLSRELGLACDNLVGATVVTADGQTLHASADENPDLFWALRGGGGNFGVVCEFEFALHEIGPMVNLGLFFWTIDQTVEAMRFMRDFVDRLPAGNGVQIVGLNAPPAPFVPEQYHFAPGWVLAVVGFRSPEDHAAIIQPIRDGLAPTFEFVTPIPYTALQQMLDESAPWGILAYEKALYLDELSDAAIAVVAEYMPKKSSPMTLTPLFPMGGAYAEVPDDDTAFGGRRSAKFVFNISAAAPDQDLLDADRTWVRAFYDALLPHASGNATYVNFLAEPDDDRVRASYGPEKYDRLARIKAKYDPHNAFHLNANIKPAD
jgi:FAD/FMN-containing dehydrogenase